MKTQRRSDQRRIERRTPKRGVNVRHSDVGPESVKRVRRNRQTARPVSRSLRPPVTPKKKKRATTPEPTTPIVGIQYVAELLMSDRRYPGTGSFDPADHAFEHRSSFADWVQVELNRARAKFPGAQNSAHEAYAVALEELDEWWDEIKRDDPVRGLVELIQLAAMCQRAAEDVYGVGKDQ